MSTDSRGPARCGAAAFSFLRNLLAALGLACLVAAGLLLARADLRQQAENLLYEALRERVEPAENTATRATAAELASLTPPQAAVSAWLARKYRVAPEPMAALVLEAQRLSGQTRLPANLILAVAAIESNFHPYIQSEVGAQGLMQVMPRIHRKRYEVHGGGLAAFDPVANMQVGVGILQDFIRMKNGSVDEGLRAYLGGVGLEEDGGYVAKVRAEAARLDRVAAGENVPLQ